jgi:hypothetical protein
MKNITLSAQDEVIDELRQISKRQNTTVNDLFRQWSTDYIKQIKHAEGAHRLKAFEESRKKLVIKSERTYTREEMNEH